jgi:hypothetical protein
MTGTSRPADTTPEAHGMLIASWRAMSIVERVALIGQLCEDVDRLGRADIIARDPTLTEAEISRALARRRYGSVLVDEAYGDHLRD